MPTKPLNEDLNSAKVAKKDEFYTQYIDIQKEVEAYLEFDPDTFRGKVVYCNCDDPFESNFFRYFAANFNKLGLKKLITASYDGSPIAGQGTLFPEYNEGNGVRKKPKALAFEIEEVTDINEDGATDIRRISTTVDAIYEHGIFRPISGVPVMLKEHERVRLIIEDDDEVGLAAEFAEWDAASMEDGRAVARRLAYSN